MPSKKNRMRIGIDFDNTIICYDEVFFGAALENKLIPSFISHNKTSIRDYLRSKGRENDWTRLQGLVYGKYITHAPAFPGVRDFLVYCAQANISIWIISHKTRYPYLGEKLDLHEAAMNWLEKNDLVGTRHTSITSANVYFEASKELKMERIGKMQCTHFIDDLPEFLLEREFPSGVCKMLFDPSGAHANNGDLMRFFSWEDILSAIKIHPMVA